MPNTPPPDFKIHVDSSCLTDSTDLNMSPERISSNQTIIHHDSWSENPAVEEENKAEELEEHNEQREEEHDEESEVWPDPTKSELERERQIDRIEAQIQAAARAVVASIEQDNYRGDDSVLSMQTDEGYDEGSQITHEEGTELTYDGAEGTYETEDDQQEHEEGGDSSSHHDGDISDDVFSHSDRSGRSSLNSCHDLPVEETEGKELTSPAVGEEAAQTMSRIPSSASYAPRESTPITPSRVLSRPPFRTPSSVRAIQMSSPTPSIFSSPRSTKRHLPTVSRIGTPNSHFSSPSKKTPTRFKAKKELPLVLLHVTVLPLTWSYSHVISSPELPPTLQNVKDNWRLLQEKLGDTVLERGILLPHPQDSYEVLEERLLEALELPVRPRARILKCGHYMGPETPTSDEESKNQYFRGEEKKWCDICERDVRFEGVTDDQVEQRFRIKIYASNGLMRAGAWAACWKEMERVDVEIEPFVEGGLAVELEHMAASAVHMAPEEKDDGFVDEVEEEVEHMSSPEPRKLTPEEEKLRRKMMQEERMREIYGPDTPFTPCPTERQRARRRHSRSVHHGETLPELLLAAFKVAVRDKKNVAIGVLSVLVLFLGLWRHSAPSQTPIQLVTMPEMVPSQIIPAQEKFVPQERALPVVASVEAELPVVVAEPKTEKPIIEVQTVDQKPIETPLQPCIDLNTAPPPKQDVAQHPTSDTEPEQIVDNIEHIQKVVEEDIPI